MCEDMGKGKKKEKGKEKKEEEEQGCLYLSIPLSHHTIMFYLNTFLENAN